MFFNVIISLQFRKEFFKFFKNFMYEVLLVSKSIDFLDGVCMYRICILYHRIHSVPNSIYTMTVSLLIRIAYQCPISIGMDQAFMDRSTHDRSDFRPNWFWTDLVMDRSGRGPMSSRSELAAQTIISQPDVVVSDKR